MQEKQTTNHFFKDYYKAVESGIRYYEFKIKLQVLRYVII